VLACLLLVRGQRRIGLARADLRLAEPVERGLVAPALLMAQPEVEHRPRGERLEPNRLGELRARRRRVAPVHQAATLLEELDRFRVILERLGAGDRRHDDERERGAAAHRVGQPAM